MKQNTSNRRPALLALTFITLGTCAVLAQPPKSSTPGVDIERSDPFHKSAAAAGKNPAQSASAETLDAQARVLFDRGETEKAILLQMDAIKKAQETLEKATKNLARYEGRPVNDGVETRLIDEKLRTIIIPKFNVANTSLEDALDFLRVRAVELDKVESNPSKKGVNFVVGPMGRSGAAQGEKVNGAEGRVISNLVLSNAPLGEVLKHVCQATGTHFEIGEHSVTILDGAE